jgi:hypothetical protein
MELENDKVRNIATEVATANLTSQVISSVLAESTTDSVGHDALKITVVLTPNSSDHIQGKAALTTLAQIRSRLQAEGEERFPIIEYATEAELSERGDI